MTAVLERLRAFYLGKLYPLVVVLLIFLGHSIGLDIVFGGIVVGSLALGCWICRDLRFAIAPFTCTIFIVTIEHSPNVPYYSRFYLEPQALIPIIVFAVLLVVSLVAFVIKNRRFANRVPIKGVFLSLLIFCVAISFNGLFSVNYVIYNLFYVTSFYLSLLLVYWLFAAFIHFDKTVFDYFMYCLVLAALLIVAQLGFAYGTTVAFENGSPVKETVLLGWGVWTAIGGMLAFLMPACFYFAANHKRGWIGYILGLLTFLAIALSQSRGALLVGCVVLLLCILTLCFFGYYRKRNRVFAAILILLGIAGGFLLRDTLMGVLQNFINYGFGDNGRFEKWEIGIRHFLEYPILGSGFYDSFVNEEWLKDVYPYLYHNTVIQFLGAGGAVGFLAYAWHRIYTVRMVVKKPSLYKTFLGIGILGLVAFSLLDVLFFNTYPTIFYALFLVFMQKSEEQAEVEE
ncbi:MAG: O-antigen ligase family protein [Clostridia bacterium]|nr:O-antigen ligase family protein [Clostridia bacterium]